METLQQTLKTVMAGYTGPALNGESLLTTSADGRLLTVVSIGQVAGETVVDCGLIARVAGERIVIDHDANNKPLIDALMQAGVPRERVVLAYAGEKVQVLVQRPGQSAPMGRVYLERHRQRESVGHSLTNVICLGCNRDLTAWLQAAGVR